MKLKCIVNNETLDILPILVGDVLEAVEVKGEPVYDITDQNGAVWCVEPYLGGYAILTGGVNFTKLRTLARFEEVVPEKKIPKMTKGRVLEYSELFDTTA